MTSYKVPTEEQVDTAMLRILTPQLQSVFFEELKNPLWLKPLAARGVFDNPPEPKTGKDELVYDTYWPQIDYLVRISSDQPKSVVDLVLKLGKSDNAWVKRAVFTIGSKIPASEAARLKPLMKHWLKSSSGFGLRSDPDEMVKFALNLLTHNKHSAGVWLADVIFRPRPSKLRKPSYGQRASFFIEEYSYGTLLPRVISVLSPRDLKVVLRWLFDYECYSGRFTENHDLTSFTRESIADRGGLGADDIPEQVLIEGTRDLATKSVLQNPAATVELLLSKKMVLSRKIAFYAIDNALKQAHLSSQRTAALISQAQRLLFDDHSFDSNCRIEYGELARSIAKCDKSLLLPLENSLNSGQLIEQDVLRDRLQYNKEDLPEVVNSRVEKFISNWRHQWLAAVGIDALTDKLKDELIDLDRKKGEIKDPLRPQREITTWVGPSSPVSQRAMESMSPVELVAHLESWHPDNNRFGPEPSHEGQGRYLSALITTNPLAVSGVGNLANRLRPTYLRALLEGWENAVKADIPLDWGQVLAIVNDVLIHDEKSSFPHEGDDFDDDPNFDRAKNAAVNLLVEVTRKRDKDIVPKVVLADFADLLIDLDDDTRKLVWLEYNSQDSLNSEMDPLTKSINWAWPMRLRGLLNLMLYGTKTSWYERTCIAFENELSLNDPNNASRAVLGEGLSRLLSYDPNWIKPKISTYFGSVNNLSTAQQIALTTAIATNYYSGNLYELLTPSLISAIRLDTPSAVGWKTNQDPLERIGQWVIEALIHGHTTMDDELPSLYFSEVSAIYRGKAMGDVGQSFMRATTVENSIRQRFAELWDARIIHVEEKPQDSSELDQFYWVAKSKKFERNWWLPRMKKTIRLDPNLASREYMIGKELANAADVDPRSALEVTKALISARRAKRKHEWDVTKNALPTVIAAALATDDQTLNQDAIAFMNSEGEKGNISLEQQVKSCLTKRNELDKLSD